MRSLFNISTLFLILVNILAIWIVWVEQWNILVIMPIYVIQGIIIGVFHYFKVLRLHDFTTEDFSKHFQLRINNRSLDVTSMDKETAKRKAGVFFLKGYLGFHFVYLIFLGGFILAFSNPSTSQISSNSEYIISQILSLYFLLAILGFFCTHGLSFFLNKEEQNQQVNLGKFLNEPFFRILPIHITIIVSGFFLFVLQQQYLALFFFLGLKTVVDVILHIRQHAKHVI